MSFRTDCQSFPISSRRCTACLVYTIDSFPSFLTTGPNCGIRPSISQATMTLLFNNIRPGMTSHSMPITCSRQETMLVGSFSPSSERASGTMGGKLRLSFLRARLSRILFTTRTSSIPHTTPKWNIPRGTHSTQECRYKSLMLMVPLLAK